MFSHECGKGHETIGDFKKALSDYEAVVKLEPGTTPQTARAVNNLAWGLATSADPKLRDGAQAARLAERAVELNPNEGMYWNTLGFNAEGGSRHAMFKTRDTHSDDLARKLQLARPGRTLARSDSFFLRAESFYNLSSYVDDMGHIGYGDVPLHQQSHGEAFLTLLTTRLGGNGLYLFDEPEAALSPQRQLTFLVGLHELVQAGSQLIIATHSPIIMAYPHAIIYHFTTEGIAPIAYEDTEHYKVTRAFLTRTEKMLGELLE